VRIAYISAGAAGMYCGSCIHDNTLAAALERQGHEVALIPLYTPTRTDETNVSMDRVFFGAINVYLQTRKPWLGRLAKPFARWLDRPGLLNKLSGLSSASSGRDLGELTVSVLHGEEGRSREELEKLASFLKEHWHPEIIHLQNSMFLGLARRLKQVLGVPVVCSLQGEDIFLEDLIEPYRMEALDAIHQRAADADGLVATSEYYADHMAHYLEVPRERISVVPLGLNLEGYEAPEDREGVSLEERPFVIGYLARICPEKGLHLLVDAFRRVAEMTGPEKVRLRVAGYLGGRDKEYFQGLQRKVKEWGLEERVDWVGEVSREEKLAFLHSLDVMSVPSTYREPKGLSILESLAAGTPVVLPDHGAYPELVRATEGGILVEPRSPEALARALVPLAEDRPRCHHLGEQARKAVYRDFTDTRMADRTVAYYRQVLAGASGSAEGGAAG
jgi:glycosyltransferase involved in cell wall biosynthesis